MSHLQLFYVEPEKVFPDHFVLVGAEAHHAIQVLRHQPGDDIHATDGNGRHYSGRIIAVKKNQVKVMLANVTDRVGEPKIYLVLALAVPKGSHADWVIEKATEIGMSEFQPLLTRYSLVDPSERIERWQLKARAAMKQCGRSFCPVINHPVKFNDYLKILKTDRLFIAHPAVNDQESRLVANAEGKVTLLIGPEGGFAEDEVRLAIQQGAVPMNLGSRRLRSETAAIVALTKLLYVAGDIG